MNVGIIITCMTCLFAVALTMGGPIRRQTSQSDKTVPIRGNVTFLCPFVPDLTWQYVYWKKNDQTIYSLEVQSNTPTTNDTRYEVSDHATRFTIKDLKKADSGIYHCKVATLATADFIKEGGQVLLSVTDQEEGLFTTSLGISFKTSTKIPPEPTEVKTIIWPIVVSILIIITLCLVFKYQKRIKESKFVRLCRRLLQQGNPLRVSGSTTSISSEAIVPCEPMLASVLCEPNLWSTPLLHSSVQISDAEETPLPPVGPLLIEDLCAENEKGRCLVVKRMRKVLHYFVELYEEEDAPQKGYNYSASIKKYLSSGNLGVQEDVLRDVEYFLEALDTIPVDRNRDVCEILLTMPVNQQSDRSMFDLYKENFLKYDEDDQVRAANEKIASTLKDLMRFILSESKTREDALNNISAIILDALVKISGSASLSQSLSQHANSRSNQSAIETEQEASPLQQSVNASKREDDNLIQFWLSKVTRIRLKFQRRVIEQLEVFGHDADSSSKEKITEEEEKNTDPNKSTDREPPKHVWPPKMELNRFSKEQLITAIQESRAPTSNNRVSAEASLLKGLMIKEIFDKDEKKTMSRPDMQNDDAKEGKNTILDKNTDQNKKSIKISGEKEKG